MVGRNGLYRKNCAIFSTSFMNCGVGEKRQKPGKLVIELLCCFNKLMGSGLPTDTCMNTIGWNNTNQ